MASMKVCITSRGEGLDSAVDPRLGMCPFLVIADGESMEAQSTPNPGQGVARCMGIKAVQAVKRSGAKALITGRIGHKAVQVLSAAGITAYQCQAGSVREAVEKLNRGELSELSDARSIPNAGTGRPERRAGGRGV